MTFNEDAEQFNEAARAFGRALAKALHIEWLLHAMRRATLAFDRWVNDHLYPRRRFRRHRAPCHT